MSINIKGGASINRLDVDEGGNLKVVTPANEGAAGFINTVNVGPFSSTTVTTRKSLRSQDYRLNVGLDKLLWSDKFVDDALNTYKYSFYVDTQSIGATTGGVVLNEGYDGSAGTFSVLETRVFRTTSSHSVRLDMKLKLTSSILGQGDAVEHDGFTCEFGLGLVSDTNTPQDGVLFRFTQSRLTTVVVNNFIETSISNGFIMSSDTFSDFRIILNEDRAEFWVDDNLIRSMSATTASVGGLTSSGSLPFFVRHYNYDTQFFGGASATLANVEVSLMDIRTNKGYSTNSSLKGLSSISTIEATAVIDDSAAPSTIVLSNTVPGYVSLGGQFQFAAPTSGETDYAVFAYYNSEPLSTAVFSKTLVITDVRIDTYNTGVANAGSPTLLLWSIGLGSTDGSLTTVDSPSIGTRGPRRLALGTQMLATTAAIGANCDRGIDANFKTPLVVEPGTYFHLIVKIPVCIANGSRIIRGIAYMNGYFE